MLGAVIWLTWVIGQQKGLDGVLLVLCGMLSLALACWIYGRWSAPHLKSSKRIAALTFCYLFGLCSIGLVYAATKIQLHSNSLTSHQSLWDSYSSERLDQLLSQNKPVFIDFTAAWCLTCQVNKRIALENQTVIHAFKNLNVTLLEADWTNRDPAISQALARFGRQGVPTYIYFNGKDLTPQILPEILTPQIILNTLNH
jgi:thiol:disulfide interchange protein DsbD